MPERLNRPGQSSAPAAFRSRAPGWLATLLVAALLLLTLGCSRAPAGPWVPVGSVNYRKVPPSDLRALLASRKIEASFGGSRVCEISVLSDRVQEAKELLRGAGYKEGLDIYP